jgi:hypothetical protein
MMSAWFDDRDNLHPVSSKWLGIRQDNEWFIEIFPDIAVFFSWMD